MKHLFHTLLLCGSLLALASCGTDDLLPTPDAGTNTPGEPDARPLISINATMGAGASANTRTGHEDVFAEGIKVSWAADDQFAIHSLDADGKSIGSAAIFTLAKGDAGKASATFEGTAPAPGDSYLICYPANVQVGTSTSKLFLGGQTQRGNNSTAHLSRFDPMLGHTVNAGDFSEISFTPDDTHTDTHTDSGHRAALMTFNLMRIPTDLGTPERILLSTTAGSRSFYSDAMLTGTPPNKNQHTLTLDLEGVTAGQRSIVAYMMMASGTMAKGEQLTITLEGSQKSYTFTAPAFTAEKEYKRGMRYIADADTYENRWIEAIINYDGTAASRVFSGMGIESDPYIIRSGNDIARLVNDVNNGTNDYAGKYFKLTRDINIAMGGGKEWTPIGTNDNKFCGHFDGGGHTISGEMTGAATHFGFFGGISGTTITNLHVSAKVTGTATNPSTTGAIVGHAEKSTISNCINTGAVSTTSTNLSAYAYAGGIAGYSSNSTIVGCANTGAITAMAVGGITGGFSVDSGVTGGMYGCFNTGLITSNENDSRKGTIVGILNSGTLSHCQYVPAAIQSADPTACGGVTDSDFTAVAKLTDLTTLNAAGVTVLNAGITTWLSTNPSKTCYLFEASSEPSTVPPVIARPGSISDIGGIGDNGAAWK